MAPEIVPTITVDGPGGAGKGTLAGRLAAVLGWHLLDSGALYRVLAEACRRDGIDHGDEGAVAGRALRLDVVFASSSSGGVAVLLDGDDVSRAIRREECGRDASRVAALPGARAALLERQRQWRRPPGLVADGRDMGTVVFPDAPLKIFLSASAEERALRRQQQLLAQGESVSLPRLLETIEERDARDRNRADSPLKPAVDALVIDSTATPADAVLDAVLQEARLRQLTD